jgi:hypothetical protein
LSSEEEEDDDEEDPTAVLLAHQRAAGRAAAHDAGPNKEAAVRANWRAIKEAKAGANWRAIKGGAGGQPTGPHGKEEVVEAQGHLAPYGVEEATRARGGKESESKDDRGRDKPAHGVATATKAHRKAHAGGGVQSPQVLPELFGGQVLPELSGAPTGKKTQGRERGESAADLFPGPQASTELFGPMGDGTVTKTNRSAHAGGGGAPKCCRSCLGRRPAKKPGGEDGAEALPIFYWAPKR